MNSNAALAFLVFYPFLAGLLCYVVGRISDGCENGADAAKYGMRRDYLADFSVILELVIVLLLFAVSGPRVAAGVAEEFFVPGICGFGLHFSLDGFRLVYVAVAAFMWMMTTILSREYFAHHENRNRFYLFLLFTLGATIGVFLSAAVRSPVQPPSCASGWG